MINIKQVWEGWRNDILPPAKIKDLIQKTSEYRLSICKSCEFNSKNAKNYTSIRPDAHCIDCGCNLIKKSKCLSCSCPKGYWTLVMTDEEEDKLLSTIPDENSKPSDTEDK